MTNNEVVERFFNHKRGRSLNMHSDGTRLYSYSTCMAEWRDDKLYINTSKYSSSTTHQMCHLRGRTHGITCINVDTHQYWGLGSVYGYWSDHDGAMAIRRKMPFVHFKNEVNEFLNSYQYGLSESTKKLVLSLRDSARSNNYKKYQAKFLKIRTSRIKQEECMTVSFAIRGHAHMPKNQPQAFCF